MSDDRMWDVHHFVSRRCWVTPHIGLVFGRYWRVTYGIGPFYGSFGYVELF